LFSLEFWQPTVGFVGASTNLAAVVLYFPQSELNALQDFYNALQGNNWRWRAPDDEHPVPWNFNVQNPNPCVQNWFGITCNNECVNTISSSSSGSILCTVEQLVLNGQHLNGTIPETISNLTNLVYLSVDQNYIHGPLPASLGQLKNLTTLDVSGNPLNTTIPDIFTNLQNLQVLDLSVTWSTGTLPKSLSDLSRSLQYMDLSFNYLSGSLGTAFCGLQAMEFLLIDVNHLTGSIPDCIGQLKSLQTWLLSENMFTGTLPESLFSIQTLSILQLHHNLCHGTIPALLSDLTSLYSLHLEENLFTGFVPSLTQLTGLNYLDLFSNSFEGPVPNISSSMALTEIAIQLNWFTGRITDLNTTMLIVFETHNNLLTGLLPPYVNETRVLLTEDTLNELNFLNELTDVPGLFIKFNELLVTHNDTANRLYYVDLSNNFFSGTMPVWAFTSTWLSYLYLNNNLLTGSIPDVPIALDAIDRSALGILSLSHNKLTGTIPKSILDQRHMVSLRLSYNQLSGTLSTELFNNSILVELAADNNRFQGTIPHIEGKNVSHVQIISLNNNRLTGTIPSGYFTNLPSLTTFALSTNCLTGSIPIEICYATSLITVIMDGMATAKECREPIFPLLPLFDSFREKNHITGGIPGCLFHLPLLQSLYLSSNAFTGDLDINEANITANQLLNLRLSYNQITGDIPKIIQEKQWNILDLSFNKFRGGLMRQFDELIAVNYSISFAGNNFESSRRYDEDSLVEEQEINAFFNSSQSLYLEINRLSGNIPKAIQMFDEISILNGNMFSCGFQRERLPEHDPQYISYSCTSDTLFQILVTIGVIVGIAVFVLACVKWRLKLNIFVSWIQIGRQLIENWNESFQNADQQLLTMFITRTSSSADGTSEGGGIGGGSGVGSGSRTISLDSQLSLSITPSCILFTTTLKFLTSMRQSIFYFVLFGICLLPVYRVLNLSESMYQNKYAWDYSAIYMAGAIAGGVLLTIFIFTIIGLYYFFCYRHLSRLKVDSEAPSKLSRNKLKKKLIKMSTSCHVTPSLASQSVIHKSGGVEDNEQDKSEDDKMESKTWLSWSWSSLLACPSIGLEQLRLVALTLVLLITMTWTTALNVAYVMFVVYGEQSQSLLIVIQVLLALIKLWTNEVAVWWLMKKIKRWIYFSIWRYFHTYENEGCLGMQFRQLEEEDFIHRVSIRGMVMIVCSVLFNNIIAPCLAVAVVSPSCFYNALFAVKTISSEYVYCSNYVRLDPIKHLQGTCIQEALGSTTFNPAFTYSYSCFSLLLVNYAAVYFYMAIMAGVVAPLGKALIKFLASYQMKSDDESTDTIPLLSSSITNSLPFSLRPLTENPPIGLIGDSSVIPSGDSTMSRSTLFTDALLSSSPLRQMKVNLFDKNRFVARIASFLALSISFGIFFPPLLAVLSLAICTMTLYEQWSIGDLLMRSKRLGYSWYLQKLSIDLEGLVKAFLSAILPVALVSASLYAWLLLDTFGDKFGLHQPITILAPVLCGFNPLILHFIIIFFIKPRVVRKTHVVKERDTGDSMVRLGSFIEMTPPATFMTTTPTITVMEKPSIIRPISSTIRSDKTSLSEPVVEE
jgi:Leucine-rich repeat (LRR) protein